MFITNDPGQTRWGREYADSMLFSGGMNFSDGGTVVEDKFLNAVVEQQGFLAAFTGMLVFDPIHRRTYVSLHCLCDASSF